MRDPKAELLVYGRNYIVAVTYVDNKKFDWYVDEFKDSHWEPFYVRYQELK